MRCGPGERRVGGAGGLASGAPWPAVGPGRCPRFPGPRLSDARAGRVGPSARTRPLPCMGTVRVFGVHPATPGPPRAPPARPPHLAQLLLGGAAWLAPGGCGLRWAAPVLLQGLQRLHGECSYGGSSQQHGGGRHGQPGSPGQGSGQAWVALRRAKRLAPWHTNWGYGVQAPGATTGASARRPLSLPQGQCMRMGALEAPAPNWAVQLMPASPPCASRALQPGPGKPWGTLAIPGLTPPPLPPGRGFQERKPTPIQGRSL